jgi:hypothetical protein
MSLEQIWRELGDTIELTDKKGEIIRVTKDKVGEVQNDIISSENKSQLYEIDLLKHFDTEKDNLVGKDRDYFDFIVKNTDRIEDLKEIEAKTGARLAKDRLFKVYSYLRLLLDFKKNKEQLKAYEDSNSIRKTDWRKIVDNKSRNDSKNATKSTK